VYIQGQQTGASFFFFRRYLSFFYFFLALLILAGIGTIHPGETSEQQKKKETLASSLAVCM
jgi:hypothetical protein